MSVQQRGAAAVAAAVAAVALAVGGVAVGTQVASDTTKVTVAAQPVSAPLRPTYQDISLKVFSDQGPFKFFRGHTATQTERDAVEETLLAVAVPELWRYGTYGNPRCAGAAKSIPSEMSKVTSKLGPIYEDNSLAGGSWKILNPNGRHYSIEQNILEDMQVCSLSGSGVECARSGYMTTALADLLDIRIDDFTHRCVKGAFFQPFPADPATYGSARAGLGFVQTKIPLPALTAQQLDLLRRTHDAHVASSDARCGTRSGLPTTTVQGAHLALEQTATSEDQHHFFRMKDFSGVADSSWDITSICKIARLQDRAHERWMNEIIRATTIDPKTRKPLGSWRLVRQADNDHQLAHVMIGMHSEAVRYAFSCPPERTSQCPNTKQTASQVLGG